MGIISGFSKQNGVLNSCFGCEIVILVCDVKYCLLVFILYIFLRKITYSLLPLLVSC